MPGARPLLHLTSGRDSSGGDGTAEKKGGAFNRSASRPAPLAPPADDDPPRRPHSRPALRGGPHAEAPPPGHAPSPVRSLSGTSSRPRPKALPFSPLQAVLPGCSRSEAPPSGRALFKPPPPRPLGPAPPLQGHSRQPFRSTALVRVSQSVFAVTLDLWTSAARPPQMLSEGNQGMRL